MILMLCHCGHKGFDFQIHILMSGHLDETFDSNEPLDVMAENARVNYQHSTDEKDENNAH